MFVNVRGGWMRDKPRPMEALDKPHINQSCKRKPPHPLPFLFVYGVPSPPFLQSEGSQNVGTPLRVLPFSLFAASKHWKMVGQTGDQGE